MTVGGEAGLRARLASPSAGSRVACGTRVPRAGGMCVRDPGHMAPCAVCPSVWGESALRVEDEVGKSWLGGSGWESQPAGPQGGAPVHTDASVVAGTVGAFVLSRLPTLERAVGDPRPQEQEQDQDLLQSLWRAHRWPQSVPTQSCFLSFPSPHVPHG